MVSFISDSFHRNLIKRWIFDQETDRSQFTRANDDNKCIIRMINFYIMIGHREKERFTMSKVCVHCDILVESRVAIRMQKRNQNYFRNGISKCHNMVMRHIRLCGTLRRLILQRSCCFSLCIHFFIHHVTKSKEFNQE